MNLRMRLKTVVAMLVFATLAYAQETTPTMHLTLDKAIELALSDNPTIKIAEQEIQLKEVAKKEAWQNLLPTVPCVRVVHTHFEATHTGLDFCYFDVV